MTSDTHAAGPVDRGEWLQTRPGERCLIRVAAAETNGAYSVVEILSQPGDSTPMHVHQNEDEHFLVLEGTARVVRGDEKEYLDTGQLVDLFPDWPDETFPLYAFYPSRRQPPAKVRAFVDFALRAVR